MSKPTKAQQKGRQDAIEHLRELLKPGNTVYTVLRHVSRSGMQRAISPIIMGEDGPYDLTYWASRALDWHVDNSNGGIKVDGCGMDMGFDVVHNCYAKIFGSNYNWPKEHEQRWV